MCLQISFKSIKSGSNRLDFPGRPGKYQKRDKNLEMLDRVEHLTYSFLQDH